MAGQPLDRAPVAPQATAFIQVNPHHAGTRKTLSGGLPLDGSPREVRTHQSRLREFLGFPPTGRDVELPFVAFYRFDANGKLTSERWDSHRVKNNSSRRLQH